VLSAGDGVDKGWLGRRVVARTNERGGYAERVSVPAENLIPVPDGVDLAAAVALAHDGPTALRIAENAAIGRDDRVLVVGAAGGLGLLLTQLAHAAGAYVVATARGKRKLDLAVEVGADQAVDYSEPDWAHRVRAATGGVGFDVVLDGVGGGIGSAAVALASDGARVSVHGAASGGFTAIDQDAVARRGLRVRGIEQVQFGAAEARPLIERALAAAAVGTLRPVIGQAVPLERAADAHAAMEARSVLGSTVLVP
jgi:NADPH2:quinone reductase